MSIRARAVRSERFFFFFWVVASLLVTSRAKAIDNVRAETRVNQAVTHFGVSGQGVLVAILDRGIDWHSNDFRHADGTTRIEAIFDLTDDSGASAPGNSYGMGTLYTRAQIDSALLLGTSLATRDAVGHGTTTTGIACGNGRNSTGQQYRGIAPNATIISVKVTSDGVPAHDGQPAEARYYRPERIPVAIDFVRAKAQQMGMPCVMLLNLGSIGGPTDGTSEISRKIDATVGPGRPGLVFVTGAGDDGGAANRAGGVVAQGGTVPLQIQKTGSGALIFDLWYANTDRFDVLLQTPNGNFGPYTSPVSNNNYSQVTNATFTYYQLGSALTFYGAANQKREIWVRIDGPPGTYTLSLTGASVTNGRFDATLNPSNFFGGTSRFLNYIAPGSIWDGATAHYNICPNSYVLRTQWVDIDGITRSLTGQGQVGELWTGSSVGPTFDGRLGIDVSAPGDRVVTSYSPTSYWATFRFNLIQGGGGKYGMAGAVSAAAPAVTGMIALMLERNPQLDAAEIKAILQQTARTDAFTGQTPNPLWGYGKIDAYSAVAFAGNRTVSGTITLEEGFDLAQPITFTFRPTNGSPAFSRTTTLDSSGFYTLDHVSAGNYRVAIKGAKWLQRVLPLNTTGGDIPGFNLFLHGGDANGDNSADALDLAVLIEAFNTTKGLDTGYSAAADLNGDGAVDALDLSILINNFNTEGDA